jgi:signal transduction histidine kinase
LISSRYAKSPSLAALVTIMAVVAIVPYIALQLKAIATSFHLVVGLQPGEDDGHFSDAVYRTAFWAAAGLAVFTIVFGVRNLDVNARHHGVVAAIALEALVKLSALIAVGLFAVYGVAGGVEEAFKNPPKAIADPDSLFGPRWVALTFLAGIAIICLPRQFHVTVVENVSLSHGRVAAWLFPTYLLLTSLFVLPIAAVGHATLPTGSDPDFYVLSLPLAMDQTWLTLFVFLGGFSSATSMVVISCIALSTMISNHLIMPLALGATQEQTREEHSGPADVRAFLLSARRISVTLILFMGFLYFRLSSGATPLASIGLVSFAGVAQFFPALLAALFWRRATARGAFVGLLAGFVIWAYTLFLPTFETHGALEGLFGWHWMRPNALFGLEGLDPLIHSLFWSLLINTLLLFLGSLQRPATALERVQSVMFIEPSRGDGANPFLQRTATANDLFAVAQRIIGDEDAHALFNQHRRRQGLDTDWPVADDTLITDVEKRIARAVGAASARAMINRVVSGETASLDSLMRIADENAELVHYSQQLETQSAQLSKTAHQLREANQQLLQLDEQKDEFLSQVSHELRTPMTSLQAFSEILLEDRELDEEQRAHFVGVIHRESLRLTRILDQILDLNQLERRRIDLKLTEVSPDDVIERAVTASVPPLGERSLTVTRTNAPPGLLVRADADRLQQVVMNVLSNAQKYNDNPDAAIWIEPRPRGEFLDIFISDNGSGVSKEDQARIFLKFARAPRAMREGVGGVGLGLAICGEIMRLHRGDISLAKSEYGGATFGISVPIARAAVESQRATDL